VPSFLNDSRGPALAVRRLRFRLRSLLVRHPRIHDAALRLRGQRFGLVDERTKIVIEGFFRSANTYALAAFRVANPRRRIAGRLHAPANVRRAILLRKPLVVLIRRPADAAVSTAIRLPEVRVRDALAAYVLFYETIERYRPGFVVVEFERAVKDFGYVIRLVNERFGTDFAEYARTEDNELRCTELIEKWERQERGTVNEMRVPRPSSERREPRERLVSTLKEPATQGRLRKAEEVYRRYRGYAEG